MLLMELIKKRERKINWIKRQVAIVESNYEGGERREQYVYLGQINEADMWNKTAQKGKDRKVSSRNSLQFMQQWRVWTNKQTSV